MIWSVAISNVWLHLLKKSSCHFLTGNSPIKLCVTPSLAILHCNSYISVVIFDVSYLRHKWCHTEDINKCTHAFPSLGCICHSNSYVTELSNSVCATLCEWHTSRFDALSEVIGMLVSRKFSCWKKRHFAVGSVPEPLLEVFLNRVTSFMNCVRRLLHFFVTSVTTMTTLPVRH